ncbi:MAG: anthranilate phosphoribosyltransferase [Desulfuromonadaceae bacterium]|nr:anthranilate phosphoribosyltransferase [Desulfuromonadaceae bacterium]
MEQMTIAEFGSYVQKLIERKNLTSRESYLLFRELMTNSQPDLQQGAFLAALTAKGETVDEIVGAWQAIDEFDTVHVEGVPDTVLDNSGTGMDSFKTFNVSSAAALVIAAHGIPVARHGARAITSRCGTVDIMEAMGVNVECSPEQVVNSINNVGIGLFNGMSPQIHPGALGRILSQIRFGTTFNIAASLANPARPKRAIRGVYSRSLLEPVTQVMKQIGFHHGLVVHGSTDDYNVGMDELSVCGTSSIHFFDGDKVDRFEIVPEDVGLATHAASTIAALNSLEQESERFLSTVTGSRKYPECEDFVALNAGAVLWMEGITTTLTVGVAEARYSLLQGAALEKLQLWRTIQS